jgi:lipoate-protein ligase B
MAYPSEYIDLGLIEYKEAWEKQEAFNEEIRNNKNKQSSLPGKLIFVNIRMSIPLDGAANKITCSLRMSS